MIFILHEIKLWFNDQTTKSKSYQFLPNKVNVITGDATTGKTSLWSIIDYCLMSGEVNIASTVNGLVSWYGIRLTINEKEFSVARRSAVKGTVSSDVYLNFGDLPLREPGPNSDVAGIKALLDTEFGVTDDLRFPFGENAKKTSFNLSFRHFLIFNSLTEDIIGTSKTYFDTTFYGKEEFDRVLPNLFNLAIGVNGMQNIKAPERLKAIDNEITTIENQNKRKSRSEIQFENEIFGLIEQLKILNFINPFSIVANLDEAIAAITEVISNKKKLADNSKVFEEINNLEKRKFDIKAQLASIESYRRQYQVYKKSLSRTADSLLPIEFMKKNLSDQLLESYESTIFINSLEDSLKSIQKSLSRSEVEPLKITGDAKSLRDESILIANRLKQLYKINTDFTTEGQKFIELGEVKRDFEQLFKRVLIKPIDSKRLNELAAEREAISKSIVELGRVKSLMQNLLERSIQRNYNLLHSLPAYKDYETLFNDAQMVLQLRPPNEIFPLENVGSKSNYMFMHLCFYLGLHEHMMSIKQVHVPQFLFIDQPSIPYYSGDSMANDDKTKLIDAFTLLDKFISHVNVQMEQTFQIFMVEHAPKEYWIENNLDNFHTVDEFNNGNGLIPNTIFKN